MSRLIFIIVIIALVYWLFKSYRRQRPDKMSPVKPRIWLAVHTVVLILPKNESLSVDGKYYCCSAHSRGQANNQADK